MVLVMPQARSEADCGLRSGSVTALSNDDKRKRQKPLIYEAGRS